MYLKRGPGIDVKPGQKNQIYQEFEPSINVICEIISYNGLNFSKY